MGTLSKNWQEVGSAQLNGGPGAYYLKLYAKYNSQSTASNSSSVSVELRIYCASGSFACYTHSANFSGQFSNSTWEGSYYHGWSAGGETTILSETKDLTHDNYGTLNLNVSGSFDCSYGINGSVGLNGTWSLPTIARYFSSTPVLTISAITETTMTYGWKTSETCDQIEFGYKSAGASSYTWKPAVSVSGTSGSGLSVTGLTAGTTYDVCLRCRRSDSQLPTESNVIQKATYSYPTVSGIGTAIISLPTPSTTTISQTVTISNPLSRTGITVYARTVGTSTIKTWSKSSVSGTSATISLNVADMYTAIGDTATRASIEYYCTYSSNTTTSYMGEYVTVEANCCPTSSGSLTYINNTSAHATLLGSNQYIIQGKSSIKITGPTYSMRTGTGTIDHYELVWGNQNPMVLSGNILTLPSVSDGANVTMKMYAIDKRGYKSAESSKVVNILPYTPPSVSLSAMRTGDYEDATGSITIIANRCTLIPSGTTDKNYWNGNTSSHKISYTASPTTSSLGGSGTINITTATVNTTLAATNLNPETAFTVTFNISDAITSNVTSTIVIEQAESLFDFNLENAAMGIGVIVNKTNVNTGLHTHGLYVTDKTGTTSGTDIQSASINLGTSSSAVTVAGYTSMTSNFSQSNPIASKTGGTVTSTTGNFSVNTDYNAKINGEIYIGGPLSNTKNGKIYLYNGQAYIPIIWYQNNS